MKVGSLVAPSTVEALWSEAGESNPPGGKLPLSTRLCDQNASALHVLGYLLDFTVPPDSTPYRKVFSSTPPPLA